MWGVFYFLSILIFYPMNAIEKRTWVYDIEQYPNYHCCTFMDKDNSLSIRQFVISRNRNNLDEYIDFLKREVKGLIGFNNLNYDYPMLHELMYIAKAYKHRIPDADKLNELLYSKSQEIIDSEYSEIPERFTLIPQLDLYRIHHFDNKAKRTSLKAVEIAIQFDNVQDLPYNSDYKIQAFEEQIVLDYNLNDVKATYEFYVLSKDLIELRKKLSKRYGINLRNANDPKIGQEIFGREIAKKKKWTYEYLKELRTYRHYIDLGECILPSIKFESEEFNTLLNELKDTVIETTKDAFDKSVIYKGFKYDYGTGGIHGCIKSGVYVSDDNYIIIDIDVKSFYPNIAIVNKFNPQHLGYEFVKVYQDLFEQRMKAQREGDKATNSGLKLSLNGVYGKSNDKFSLFYDPKYTMQITVNGQLLLSMLAEKIVNTLSVSSDEVQMLQVNTDGLTVRIHRKHEEQLYSICEDWEYETKLILEYAKYSKMIIRDVNNYLSVTEDGKIKPKGCFEITPMQNGAIAYNKDWSMRVVPKALHAYYLEEIPVTDFIKNHKDIYDFCLGFRSKGEWELYKLYAAYGKVIYEKLQKTIRYYISDKGATLIKKNVEDGREIQLNAGYVSTLFNKYEEKPFEKYEINYRFYIKEAYKIIYAIDSPQLTLNL